MTARAPLSVLAGALLLLWPAFVNGYPLLFSDTGAFLHQTTGPLMIWDKPWIYGPLMHLFHWEVSLWPVALAQGLAVSHLLWLALRAIGGGAGPARHLLLCGLVAALTTAPFTVALLMPDVMTPVTLLALALLALAPDRLSRGERAWLAVLGAVAVASHLSHLPLAGAVVAGAVLVGRWRGALRAAVPLAGAVALLLATNLAGHGRLSLSPHGATFALARLIANGSAARTIVAECPARGWYLCAWAGRLPTDSDVFLWEPDSPVNMDAEGRPRFLGGALLSPEAREIVAETIRREPFAVARDALRDTAIQLVTAGIGDTLRAGQVGPFVRVRLEEAFPPAEVARLDASAQARDLLAARVAPFAWVHAPVLALGFVALLALALRGWRRGDGGAWGFAALLLLGVLANAFATGALSGPHDRYAARLEWLLVAGAVVLAMRERRSAAGDGQDQNL